MFNRSFCFKELLENHIKKCICDKELKPDEVFPTGGKNIKKFENINNEFLHPFHIVADFESTLEEVKDDEYNNTQKYQKHVANSFGLKYNCIHKEYSEPVKIVNIPDKKVVVKKFVETIEGKARSSYKLMKQNIDNIVVTKEQNNKHKECIKCSRCECDFTDENKM